ncbi:MAG: hypothetical protein AAF479_13705 [Pseudomonadota bacterium]
MARPATLDDTFTRRHSDRSTERRSMDRFKTYAGATGGSSLARHANARGDPIGVGRVTFQSRHA